MIASPLRFQTDAEKLTTSLANLHGSTSYCLPSQTSEAAHAFQDLQNSLESLARKFDGVCVQSGEKDCTVTYKSTHCTISFWHVLDIRFKQYGEEKGRADMLLTWLPGVGVWQNRRRTVVLKSDELAVHCLERVLLICNSRLAQV